MLKMELIGKLQILPEIGAYKECKVVIIKGRRSSTIGIGKGWVTIFLKIKIGHICIAVQFHKITDCP